MENPQEAAQKFLGLMRQNRRKAFQYIADLKMNLDSSAKTRDDYLREIEALDPIVVSDRDKNGVFTLFGKSYETK